MLSLNTCSGALVVLLTLVNPAVSHITANPSAAYLNTYFQTAFRVPHGCSGSPTVKLTIDIPDGVINVAPHQIYNWTISIAYRPLFPPVISEGAVVNQTVSSVTYSGYLDPTCYEDFGISMKLPAQVPNSILYFPAHQICVNGSTDWTNTPQSGQNAMSLPAPAPSVQTVPQPSSNSASGVAAAASFTNASSHSLALAFILIFAFAH
ncbi:hypothetical protein K493DRAFT_376781 [Basidiobolus meristosporus CBS 931.73]|uniref:YncI copper-binding domain-containing protein n=1 Tax=Basidiobolus meristosporus CBS 931.73 TaxID=1314790 RepID=A0A1Y1Y3D5_9FUNG|nr:hypothetical protein K493DRAFT_376781 [Basidiobolus meristosporus CBS 931.73]|eukprot:ORX92503.1 hypothetical protein K493DRAFT_376781 [Basidiobolus meristosporus CBS 931.73]